MFIQQICWFCFARNVSSSGRSRKSLLTIDKQKRGWLVT